jgi:hypothetical protein
MEEIRGYEKVFPNRLYFPWIKTMELTQDPRNLTGLAHVG